MNRRSKTSLLIGLIVVLVTVGISLITLGIDDWTETMTTGLTGWAFGTLVWSEIVFFGGFAFVEWFSKRSEQIITRISMYAILPAYGAICFVVSLIYMLALKEAYKSFIIVHIVLFALTFILLLILLSTSKGIHASNQRALKAMANADALVERLNKLSVDPALASFAPTLRKLSDDLRYSDTTKVTAEDEKIASVLSSIEIELSARSDSTDATVKSALVHLNTLIAQRKISLSAANKGSI